MSNTTKAIWAFWIFIIGMMGWEFYSYNETLSKQAEERAKNDPNHGHYFFYLKDPKAQPKPEEVKHEDAFLLQTAFKVEPGVPNYAMFTCHVTLKNTGNAKATSVQVRVRPFKGSTVGDGEMSSSAGQPLPDSDPVSEIDQWVSFPDIEPGQSATGNATFYNKPGYNTANNPNPELRFQSAKPTP